jgi:transcription antitermination factor NusG
MAEQTFTLLKVREGLKTSINGATQIRAGVVRPEIVIPLETTGAASDAEDGASEGILEVGSSVRIIREPYFGKLGRVTELPVELQNLETEAQVRVLRVELENGEQTTLPRANVEAIERG